MGDTSKLGFDYPDVVVHSTEQVAPAGATVLADSGAVPTAGKWRFRVTCATDDSAQNILQVAHRNAANGADVELADMQIGPNSQSEIDALFTMAASERVVVRPKAAITAAKTIQVNIHGWLL